MCRDNLPTIRLGSWDVNSNLFEGEVAAGPCPIFFSRESEAAAAALEADPARCHADLQRIMKVFFSREIVNLRDSVAIVKKPRSVLVKRLGFKSRLLLSRI